MPVILNALEALKFTVDYGNRAAVEAALPTSSQAGGPEIPFTPTNAPEAPLRGSLMWHGKAPVRLIPFVFERENLGCSFRLLLSG